MIPDCCLVEAWEHDSAQPSDELGEGLTSEHRWVTLDCCLVEARGMTTQPTDELEKRLTSERR